MGGTHAAGMACLAVAHTFAAQQLQEAHRVMPDLAVTTLDDLQDVLDLCKEGDRDDGRTNRRPD